jgi:hypothetical protein
MQVIVEQDCITSIVAKPDFDFAEIFWLNGDWPGRRAHLDQNTLASRCVDCLLVAPGPPKPL